MKRTKLKKPMTVEKYILSTKRDRHIRKDNENNINIFF